jgi:hypothetical protein
MRIVTQYRFISIFILLSLCLWITPKQGFTQQVGRISSAPCPFNCKTLGLNSTNCREWVNKKRCFVHDLTKGPYKIQTKKKIKQTKPSKTPRQLDHTMIQACKYIDPYYIQTPRVNIISAKRQAPYFRGLVSVKGYIDGACIVDANYFEDGERVLSLPIETTRTYQRFDFSLTVPADKKTEIRVYNALNQRASVRINELEDNTTKKKLEHNKPKKKTKKPLSG